MPKQARLNRIKSLRCYTIEEAAEVTGVSTRTIRSWTKNGLQPMDEGRPALVRGDDLRAYIKSQRDGRKHPTGLDEFFCVRCRAVRKAADGDGYCVISGHRAKVSAFCERCETVMHKPVAEARIPELSGLLDLKITRTDETL